MIRQNILFFIVTTLFASHIYIGAHSGPEEYNLYGQPDYQQPSYIPAYQPYSGPTPSAPPFEEPKTQSVEKTYVYVKEKITVVEKKDEFDLALAAETFAKIWHLFYTIDESGRTVFGAILGTLIFSGVSVLCGNDVVSPTTGFAALGGTLTGGAAGLGYTLLYGTPKTQEPKVTVHVKTTYSY